MRKKRCKNCPNNNVVVLDCVALTALKEQHAAEIDSLPLTSREKIKKLHDVSESVRAEFDLGYDRYMYEFAKLVLWGASRAEADILRADRRLEEEPENGAE